jgi:hypothetical protein
MYIRSCFLASGAIQERRRSFESEAAFVKFNRAAVGDATAGGAETPVPP